MLFTHYINIVDIINKIGKPAHLSSYCKKQCTITIVHFLLFIAPHSEEVATQKVLPAYELHHVKKLETSCNLLLINPSLNCCNRYHHI